MKNMNEIENENVRKSQIAKRRKRFFALVLSAVFAVLPTVNVLAADINCHYTGAIPELDRDLQRNLFTWDNNEISPGQKVTFDRRLATGGQVVVWFYRSEGGLIEGPVEGEVVTDGMPLGTKSTVTVGNAGIDDLDHWEIRRTPDFEPQLHYSNGENYNSPLQAQVKLYAVVRSSDADFAVAARPRAGGTVSAKINGADVETVRKDNVVNLKAEANDGYRFKNWSTQNANIRINNSTSPNATVTVLDINENIRVIGHFERINNDGGNGDDDDDDDDANKDDPPVIVDPFALGAHYYKNGVIQYNTLIGRQEQSPLAKQTFTSAIPKGWHEAFSMSMSVDGKNEYSLKDGELELIVPTAYRKAGREFAILAMDKNGEVIFLENKEKQINVVKVNPNIEGYAFYLIYKD